MYTARHDVLERLHRETMTHSGLKIIEEALVCIIADAARKNTKNTERHTTELSLTAEEAANALRVVQHALKPLPEGTMTA